jgi:segregation and condensation protein B
MEIGNIIPHIEALIFASDKPLTSMEITELINNAFGFMEEKLTLEQIQTSLDGIIEKYASEFYPFEVRESGGGWQFLTKRDYHKTIAQLNGEKFLKRLSSAALETLAIIAYKQPITKGEIEAIRGVSSDYSIQKLLEKELIVISGRNEDMPGKPLVYATSKTFMDYFGINSAADLPKLKEIFAETLVEGTVINHNPAETLPADDAANPDGAATPDEPATPDEAATHEGAVPLVVTEEGELLEGDLLESQSFGAPESAAFGTETDEQADDAAAEATSFSGEGEEASAAPDETGGPTEEDSISLDEAAAPDDDITDETGAPAAPGESTSESDEEGDDEASGFPDAGAEQTSGEGEDPDAEDPDHPGKH